MKDFEMIPCPLCRGEMKCCAIYLEDGLLIKCSECNAREKEIVQ